MVTSLKVNPIKSDGLFINEILYIKPFFDYV